MSELEDSPELVLLWKIETQRLIRQLREHITTLQQALSNGKKRKRKQSVWGLFSCTHALYTVCKSMGVQNIEDVSEALLGIFRLVTEGKLKIRDDDIFLLSEGIETCQKILNNEKLTGYQQLLDRLKCIRYHR